jgi:hypothetical protein
VRRNFRQKNLAFNLSLANVFHSADSYGVAFCVYVAQMNHGKMFGF